jgi:hypothetical protein
MPERSMPIAWSRRRSFRCRESRSPTTHLSQDKGTNTGTQMKTLTDLVKSLTKARFPRLGIEYWAMRIDVYDIGEMH